MRTALQFLLILFACAAGCFLLAWSKFQAPLFISGSVIDVTTGRPVPYARIHFQQMNGSIPAATADATGHFRYVGKMPYICCFLFVPESGTILQTRFHSGFFGRGLGIYTGIVVPFVPPAELSGHVFGEDGRPLPGCSVRAVANLPQSTSQHFQPGLKSIGFAETDQSAAFNFKNLGADRYFVLVQCPPFANHPMYSDKTKEAWNPMLYPQANTLNEARSILLRPADRVAGIDFHLHPASRRTLRGLVTLSDGKTAKKWPAVIYSHDLKAKFLDPGMAVFDLSSACDWRTPADEFTCDLLAGYSYQLHFQIDGTIMSSLNVPAQEANIEVQVPETVGIQRLNVQLTNISRQTAAPESLPSPPTGTVRIHHACPGGHGSSLVGISVYAHPDLLRANQNPWVAICSAQTVWTLAAGDYRLLGYAPSGARFGPRLDNILESQAQPVTIRQGSTIEIDLKVWTVDEIIRLAIDGL